MIISQTDVFDPPIIGSFGNFKTKDSYELNYLMATLTLSDLDLLTTASKAVDFTTVSFEEMVQRDIDYSRVDNDIVKGYLENGKDRVIFFPPLLVTLMSFEDGVTINQYKSVDETEKDFDRHNHLSRIFDKDKFELLLPIAEQQTGYEVWSDRLNKNVSYHHYAAKIRVNSRLTKLVVIDGQHRFSALKRILKNSDQNLLGDIKIPICLFFSPKAVADEPESIKDSMRELFVTINNTAKQVSGHFLTLLNDKSLSAMAVRSLASKWKSDEESDCKLYFLEWNQRESKKSSQRTRKYSITTISIIADALKDYAFKNLTDVILNTAEVESDLLSTEQDASSNIGEDSFLKSQTEILKKQVDTYVTPAISHLFLELSPYKKLQHTFCLALKQLNQQVKDNIQGADTFQKDVLLQFRETTEYDTQLVKDIEKMFENNFKDSMGDLSFYFTNVFQTGLIYAWTELCSEFVIQNGVTPEKLSEALVEVANILIDSTNDLFTPQREYTQGVIFKGQKISVTINCKIKIGLVLLSVLLNKSYRRAFMDKIGAIDIDVRLEKLGKDAFESYINYFKECNFKAIKKNWRFLGFEDAIESKLGSLEKRANTSKSKEDLNKFDNAIDDLVIEKGAKAAEVLANILDIKCPE